MFILGHYSTVWQKRRATVHERLCPDSFKASLLSPTRITANAISADIAAKLNGSLLSRNQMDD